MEERRKISNGSSEEPDKRRKGNINDLNIEYGMWTIQFLSYRWDLLIFSKASLAI